MAGEAVVAVDAPDWSALSAWVVYQLRRDSAIAACPWVRDSGLTDLRKEMP